MADGELTPIVLYFYMPGKSALLYLSYYYLPLLQVVIRLLGGCREEGEAEGSSPPEKSLSCGGAREPQHFQSPTDSCRMVSKLSVPAKNKADYICTGGPRLQRRR